MPFRALGKPLIAHGLIVLLLLTSMGVAKVVYVDPRNREIRGLAADRLRIGSQLTDLQQGIQEMERWTREHPGQDLLTFRSRRALPAAEMVSGFLRSLADIARRNRVQTELIQPAGAPVDEVVADASGSPVTYRKTELRLRLYAGYRSLGEYLREIEGMDQLVIVRSLALQYEVTLHPDLAADLAIWLYGAP